MTAADAGSPEQPVAEVAERAAEHEPERHRPARASAAGSAARTITTTTASATAVRMIVNPVPSEKAAPELRAWLR